ncbi:TetR/AcrR family transcriptional regulator [Yinghuangia aomiensis]
MTRSMKTRLGLRDIVLAARAVLAEGGAPALTMAAVARRLGVTPMALYRHVDGRDELLAAVADSVLEDVGAAAAEPGLPWWDAVESWMRDVRHRIVESPWTAQLIGTPTQIAPAWAGRTGPAARRARTRPAGRRRARGRVDLDRPYDGRRRLAGSQVPARARGPRRRCAAGGRPGDRLAGDGGPLGADRRSSRTPRGRLFVRRPGAADAGPIARGSSF